MKIIKQGKIPEEIKEEITVYKIIKCNNCNTVFQPEYEDLHTRFQDLRNYFLCPLCKKRYEAEEQIKNRRHNDNN